MLLKVKNTPYCISIKDAWIQYGFIYVQTELCQNGSLDVFLIDNGPLGEKRIWEMCSELLQGLKDIHSQNMVHLDIKPGNIFISRNGVLKIGDFGLASLTPIENSDLEGDRRYLAPEVLFSGTVSYP